MIKSKVRIKKIKKIRINNRSKIKRRKKTKIKRRVKKERMILISKTKKQWLKVNRSVVWIKSLRRSIT